MSPARHEDARQASPTILIVDDDRSISRLLEDLLTHEGYRVETASSGAEAESRVEELRPSLVILDILLPDTDGLLLCQRLQARWPGPVIMLSGSKRESDRVLSLRLGADDFIAKPFDTLELVARVEAVLRRRSQLTTRPRELGAATLDPDTSRDRVAAAPGRGPSTGQDQIHVGALTIDARRRTVTIGSQPVHLTPTENRLLSTLASEPERVFSRDELAEVLWGYESLGDSRAVDVHIRRLRGKLEPFEDEAPPIVTVRGFGYKLSAPVDEPTP